jgi:MCP family monocarboxylic acid transporter-like MFS transporter 10
MSEWFVARRGLANGVISAGTATGGLILPLILPPLLERYGAPSTLRILSIGFGILLVPILPFLRGRLPHAKVRGPIARSTTNVGSWEWVKNPELQLLLIANTIQGFGMRFCLCPLHLRANNLTAGYFVPVVWLPSTSSCTLL